MNKSVKIARLEDYDKLKPLHKEVHDLHVKGRPDKYKTTDDTLDYEYFKETVENDNGRVFIIEENQKVVAFTIIRKSQSPRLNTVIQSESVFIEDFGVDEAFRGMGLGKLLFEEVVAFTKELGIMTLELGVWEFNQNAIGFYESMGMQAQSRKMEIRLGRGSENVLKSELKQLDLQKNIKVDFDWLIKQMLENIGSTDPELRDKLIYTTFYQLISEDFLSSRQMNFLLEACLEESYLFYKIGQIKEDSVFTRSFSSLVLALLIDKDRVKPFLTEELAQKTIESSMQYLEKELDTRGYVEGKGWAHSIAHGADYLVACIKHPAFQFTERCLSVIKECLFKEALYCDDEDGRIIFAIEALLDKGMDEESLERWIFGVSNTLKDLYDKEGYSLYFYRKKTNVTNFMKTLYFRLEFLHVGKEIRQHIVEELEKWHKIGL
ncbi:GNAT family N-acetyltransferase [Rossellomorea aquimaris]|uniref:GNAT family N-acetyltransferase n=1 Tax=Rossellomorea aquimaris TaxID=189382 RepID=UPI0007D0870D|nr:GNAT family N-acetyltransferase [Rossellomorea aquimaris]